MAVLGPERPYVQVGLSATDARTLGVKAPLKMSGDVNGAGDVDISGPEGVYDAKGSAIVAQAHIHLTPDDAAKAGVSDGQRVSVTIRGERPATFENVICYCKYTVKSYLREDDNLRSKTQEIEYNNDSSKNEDTSIAVSYTRRDVYKRQKECFAGGY